MIFKPADVLLPKFCEKSEEMTKWSVVACDQYTSEPEYWENTDTIVGCSPSTLRLIVPEIYLNDENIDSRISDVNTAMCQYVSDGIFEEYKNTYIYIERTQANGAVRRGIVGCVDLEEYDYSVGSVSKIRATEGTVLSRIPPRLKVRTDAAVELPHIMMLIDDLDRDIIEYNDSVKDSFEKVYDFDLMNNSGHILGYRMSREACDILDRKLSALEDIESFNCKYGLDVCNPLVFAVGDGNHSLATAKAHFENIKKELGEAATEHPARYALCELVNLHDDSLVFEAIHRVVFDADRDKFMDELKKMYDISYDSSVSGHKIRLVLGGEAKDIVITNSDDCLAVGAIQKFIDEFCSKYGCEVDYIHGEDVVMSLCESDNNIGIILDAMDKRDLFRSVAHQGALPRKTFSMGDAWDKRFYVEARKIK